MDKIKKSKNKRKTLHISCKKQPEKHIEVTSNIFSKNDNEVENQKEKDEKILDTVKKKDTWNHNQN